jgi:hypothetical protein
MLYHQAGKGPEEPSCVMLAWMRSTTSMATLTQRMEHWRAMRWGRDVNSEFGDSGVVQNRDIMGRNRSMRMWRNLELC